eukprot:1189258-Prorocentrum_minimum.AAC.1
MDRFVKQHPRPPLLPAVVCSDAGERCIPGRAHLRGRGSEGGGGGGVGVGAAHAHRRARAAGAAAAKQLPHRHARARARRPVAGGDRGPQTGHAARPRGVRGAVWGGFVSLGSPPGPHLAPSQTPPGPLLSPSWTPPGPLLAPSWTPPGPLLDPS